MKESKFSMKNINNGLTISGLNVCEIEDCKTTDFDIMFDCWNQIALKELESESDDFVISLLNTSYEIGGDNVDFYRDFYNKKKEISAYLLVLLDEYAERSSNGLSLHECSDSLHKIYECVSYLSPSINTAKEGARKAANARHAENRELRQNAFEWYQTEGHVLKNDDAAMQIIKLVPVSLRTAQGWITDFRKKLRFARTP